MRKSIYDENETMQFLGMQAYYLLTMPGGIAREDFGNILEAHRKYMPDELSKSLDFFTIGYIYGKRAERARQQGREPEPIAYPEKIRREPRPAAAPAEDLGEDPEFYRKAAEQARQFAEYLENKAE